MFMFSTRIASFRRKAGGLRRARLIFSPPPLSTSHPRTPPPSRWPVLTTLPPLAKCKLDWRCFCEALGPSSSLAGQTHRRCRLVYQGSLQNRKYHVCFEVNMSIKAVNYDFGQCGSVHSEGRSLNTTVDEGPIERHKSQLASRETGDRLTGTHSSGGSLDRTESVSKYFRKRRACTGLREASQRDEAMRSMPPFPPEKGSFRFVYYCVPFCDVYHLQQ